MMRKHGKWGVVAVCLAVLGCGGGSSVMLNYILPAQYEVPPAIQQVAVVRFTALKRTDDTYGEVAAAKLNEALIESGRYQMYNRRQLEQVMEEQDFRESGMALAGKVRTKVPSVDAIIRGSVDAGHQYGTDTQQVFDPVNQTMKTVTVQYLICEATLTFEMIEVNTARVIASVGEVAAYDSRKQSGWSALAAMAGVGPTGSRLPAPDSKLKELIAECVAKFVQKVAPHRVAFKVSLEGGKSGFVSTGNKFAKAGEWREAENFYRQGIQADVEGKDHGAWFNLGVALEAQGRVQDAAEAYRKAIGMKADKKYIESLARVRQLGGSAD